MNEEVIIADPDTGGQKGVKIERVDLIPADALLGLSRVYGKGSRKYPERNWELGYRWGLSFGAAQRHLWQFWNGQDTDPESGESHLLHAAWHCLTLYVFQRFHLGTDDRSTHLGLKES